MEVQKPNKIYGKKNFLFFFASFGDNWETLLLYSFSAITVMVKRKQLDSFYVCEDISLFIQEASSVLKKIKKYEKDEQIGLPLWPSGDLAVVKHLLLSLFLGL